jgi:ferritin
MISSELEDAINDQIKMEFESASYYLGMSTHFKNENWDGFAHFMKAQSLEEVEHAMKFRDFLYEVDGQAVIPGLDQPKSEYDSIEAVFETALQQEKDVTESISNLVDTADANGDKTARSLLQWFIDEQVEEENLMDDILTKVRRLEGDKAGLVDLDEELGERPLEGEE